MAHSLDDRQYVSRLDPKQMLEKFEQFPAQCREALAIGMSAPLPELSGNPRLVMLTGLGGSAAGGDFMRALFEAEAATPFIVNRDYHLPKYVGKGDLVFATSYSGNTEETLSAYAEARAAGATVVVISSGGKLAEMASTDGNPVCLVPGGFPPRAALGYMLMPGIAICERLGLLPAQDYEAAFAATETMLAENGASVPFGQNQAKQIGEAMHGSATVLYGLGHWQAVVANRWKGQFNENAKNLAFPNAFPELNHNEILGWVKAHEQHVERWIGVILEDGNESAKMQARAEITTRLIGETAQFFRVRAKGDRLLARMLSLTAFGDLASIYLAALNGIDPENIDWINTLKHELASVPG